MPAQITFLMKVLLLFLMIHLLVFHQYRKDKYEILSPKREKEVKDILPVNNQSYLFRPINMALKDSLLFSYKKVELNNFPRYTSGVKKKYPMPVKIKEL